MHENATHAIACAFCLVCLSILKNLIIFALILSFMKKNEKKNNNSTSVIRSIDVVLVDILHRLLSKTDVACLTMVAI